MRMLHSSDESHTSLHSSCIVSKNGLYIPIIPGGVRSVPNDFRKRYRAARSTSRSRCQVNFLSSH